MSFLREYFTTFRENVALYDYLLKFGTPYVSQKLTFAERRVVLRAARQAAISFQWRECFYNAQLLVLADSTGQLTYAEGIGTKTIPCLHGWATINGKVVDLTWRQGTYTEADEHDVSLGNRVWGEFPWEYWGVEIPREYVRRVQQKDKVAKSLLDDAENDWALLRKGSPP